MHISIDTNAHLYWFTDVALMYIYWFTVVVLGLPYDFEFTFGICYVKSLSYIMGANHNMNLYICIN